MVRLWTSRGGVEIGMIVRDVDACGCCGARRFVTISPRGTQVQPDKRCCFQTPGAALEQLITTSEFYAFNQEWFLRSPLTTKGVTPYVHHGMRWATLPRARHAIAA